MMNKITFDDMLRENGLPPVGEVITTPMGDKVEVLSYTYGIYYHSVKVRPVGDCDGCIISWTMDQIRLCTWEGKE
jgi:hypothetical protein